MKELKIKELGNSEIEIEGELPFKELEKHRSATLKALGSNIKMDGFRAGHVPEKVLLEKIGEPALLEGMANRALSENYPKIIIEKKINPIANPQVTITKLAQGNPLGFKMKVPVMPEVKLPEYKKIAKEVYSKKEELGKITKEEEEENIIKQILATKAVDGKTPELTDALVKELGEFKTVKDFKEKVLEGIGKEKEFKLKEKKRVEVIEEIIKQSEINLPDIIIESELDKMIAQFQGDIKRMGLEVEKYLEGVKKTVEDLRKEWRPEAEKRGKSQLILNKIALEEKISPKKEEVEKETEHLLSHQPEINKDRVKVYTEMILTNEKVMKFLEKQKVDEEKKE
jgi:FKBP-type peptidyl-prolyl cis-trans isomerase (trigger factor)